MKWFLQVGCYEVFGKSVADRLEVLIPILAATFVLQVINPNKQGGGVNSSHTSLHPVGLKLVN